MDSKVIALYPYQQVDLSRFQKVFLPDQEKIETEIRRLLNRKSVWTAAGRIQKGDIVTCRMQSEIEKYNRDSIKITVGLGLFDRELEQKLLSAGPGDHLILERQGRQAEVWVQEILHKTVPRMQDAFVQELGIPGVATEEAYRDWLIQQQKQEALNGEIYEVLTYVMDTVLANSRIETAPREYELYVEGQLAKLGLIAGRENLKLEEMTPEEFEGRIPVRSYEELVELVRKDAVRDIRIALAGWQEAQRQGYVIDDTRYEDFVREGAAELGVEEARYRQAFTGEFAKLLMAANFYYTAVEDYIKENLYVEG